jgi:hypothetical protein
LSNWFEQTLMKTWSRRSFKKRNWWFL